MRQRVSHESLPVSPRLCLWGGGRDAKAGRRKTRGKVTGKMGAWQGFEAMTSNHSAFNANLLVHQVACFQRVGLCKTKIGVTQCGEGAQWACQRLWFTV
eukprot:2190572-Rhodomonas_salina.2